MNPLVKSTWDDNGKFSFRTPTIVIAHQKWDNASNISGEVYETLSFKYTILNLVEGNAP